jgi:ABC-type transport system involved in multi-copper enzyme maturation permease subunit
MNAWPLLHRELLVGARRKSTRWLRVGVAAGAILLGALFIVSLSVSGRMGTGMMGSSLFQVLVSMAFGITGLFGVFFAADAISSERREGTLGLLFLTRLRGRDVVLGKLTSTSLRSAYALMAGLPVMALPIILGGVTFKSYAFAALVLGNTLFLSVSAGLLVSSFNRKPVRAVMGTLFLVLSIVGLPFLMDTIMSAFDEQQWTPFASLLSPGYSLSRSLAGTSAEFLWGVLGQHLIGWLFLSVAARRTSRITEKIRQPSKAKAVRWLRSADETTTLRLLRDRSPIQWLISHRSRGPTITALIVVALTGVVLLITEVAVGGSQQTQAGAMAMSAIQGLFSFVLLIWLTVEAARQTGDARSSDAFELLLATPLTTAEIVSGFFHGIWRIFGVAILTVLLLQLVSAWLLWSGGNADFGAGGVNVSIGGTPDLSVYQLISAVFGVVNFVASCLALIWVGMWMGLRSESTTAAAAKTYVFVIVIPGIFLAIGVGLLFGIGLAMAGFSMFWLNAVIQGVAALLVKLGFILWARRQLLRNFREAANGTLIRRRSKKGPLVTDAPPPLPTVP